MLQTAFTVPEQLILSIRNVCTLEVALKCGEYIMLNWFFCLQVENRRANKNVFALERM
jgi:hypothetical protein